MARLTNKQQIQYEHLFQLFHEMIRVKLTRRRTDFDDVIARIREEVKEEEPNEQV